MTLSEKSSIPLRVLIVEDSEDDANLVIRNLRKGGYESVYERVETAEKLRGALSRLPWDVIISDFAMPYFDGITALKISQESGLDLPFILVSGTITDEIAVRVMKAGAHDFIDKTNLARLIPAIEREMREAEVRRERRRMEEDLEAYHAGLKKKVEERTAELRSVNAALHQEITERKRAETEMRKGKELSDTVNRINSLIFSTIEFDRIMQSVLIETAKATGADAAVIYVPDGEFWTARYAHGLADFEGKRVTVEDIKYSILAVKQRRPVIVNDLPGNRDMCRIPVVLEYGVKALLDAPLVAGEDVIGNFSLYSCKEGEVFSSAHEDFMNKVSASISLAVKNARLFKSLGESEERYKAFVSASSQALYHMSPDWGEMQQLQGGSFIADTKKPNRNWLQEYIHPDDQKLVLGVIDEAVRTGKVFELEHRVRRVNGTLGWTFSRAVPVRNAAGEIMEWFGAAIDITDRKKMEEEIKHMAHHDPLTGLPNRRLFTDILKVELAQARRHKSKLAVLFLDLDRFKDINDTLGHEVGDELLKEVGRRFRRTIRESDTVARIGGDEFNIVMADIHRTEDISDFAQKIILSLRQPVIINENELNITTSIGISVYPVDSENIEVLRKYADIAMYDAKQSGRNMYQFYNPSINIRSIERIRLEGMLRRSIDAGELVIYYQPQINIRSKQMICAEALVRWRHPEQGLLLPDRFLPLAEETGFITQIDDWALKTVCRQVRAWINSGLPPVCVTVNLSSRRFQSLDLVNTISSVLAETDLPPGCLDIEVTETLIMSDVERTASQLRSLREMGVHVSIDDFGTGYSSLSYLKRLPIDRLKIDKSFIRDIAANPDDRAIIHAVTAMAHTMKLKVVAEGVETEEQLKFLRETGCDEMQGFLVSEPLPPEQLMELVLKAA